MKFSGCTKEFSARYCLGSICVYRRFSNNFIIVFEQDPGGFKLIDHIRKPKRDNAHIKMSFAVTAMPTPYDGALAVIGPFRGAAGDAH